MRPLAACVAIVAGMCAFQGCVAPVARYGAEQTALQSYDTDNRKNEPGAALGGTPPATPPDAAAPDEPLLVAIRSFIGTPYHYGGINKRGMDCSGFVIAVFLASYRMLLPHSSVSLYNMAFPIPADSVQPGDLVFFRTRHSRGIDHVGICLDERRFAHASPTSGVMVSSLSEEYFRKHFAGIRRLF
jgi:cell wall-associated NlpC family hydrolase